MVLRWPVARGAPIDGTLADAHWTVERHGFLNPGLRIRLGGGGPELGQLRGSRLTLPGTDGFQLHRLAGLLLPSWQVTDLDGSEVLHLEPVREGRRLTGGAVLVSPAGTALPGLSVLLALTWTHIALAWFEDELAIPYENLMESTNQPDVD